MAEPSPNGGGSWGPPERVEMMMAAPVTAQNAVGAPQATVETRAPLRQDKETMLALVAAQEAGSAPPTAMETEAALLAAQEASRAPPMAVEAGAPPR